MTPDRPVPRPVAAREGQMRWAEVDPSAIRDNAASILRVLGGGVALMAMVKAGAYGHGAVVAAAAACAGGATWLGVSSPDEALELAAEGLGADILTVGWTHPGRLAELIAAGVHLAVWEPDQVAAAAAAAAGRPARLHLKIDSGMGRLGSAPRSVPDLMRAVEQAGRRVEPVGAFTHFADADAAGTDHTLGQDRVFLEAVGPLRERWPGLLLHAANSAATLRLPQTRHDLVRCGIALYGYPPEAAAPGPALRPAMAFKALVTQVKTVLPGQSVGYGRTWVAERETRVATVAAGYADGIHRAQSNRGTVLIGGRRCPVIGRISMDHLTADVSAAEAVRPGDEVVLFGRQGSEWLGADEVAAAGGTISYEILCAVSSRVPRFQVAAVPPVPSAA
ncbi:MAG: alanine racemase [Candidatus Dormibacteria bacterium]|jgi:alanine racemase